MTSSKKKLDLEDVFCIACRNIYLQPVTMECNHTLCLECFKSMVNITAYQCPICRKRISNWLRRFKHNYDALINKNLWEAVQQQYPIEVKKRLNDEDDGLEERIVGQGFTRVQVQQGELKKEFENMKKNFEQEQAVKELQNLELAKQLQEEEEAEILARRVLNEKLSQEDAVIASAIQQKLEKEKLHDGLSKSNDMHIAKILQSQLNRPKKEGPLDIMFSKIIPENLLGSCKNKENISSSSSSAVGSSSSINSSYAVSSMCSTPSTSFSASSSSNTFDDEYSDDCVCGRLLNNNTNNSPCKFCTAQISLFEELAQKKSDFLMAKRLEKQLRMDNLEDYNLRKRSNTTQSRTKKKIRKLDKGQQTLKKFT